MDIPGTQDGAVASGSISLHPLKCSGVVRSRHSTTQREHFRSKVVAPEQHDGASTTVGNESAAAAACCTPGVFEGDLQVGAPEATEGGSVRGTRAPARSRESRGLDGDTGPDAQERRGRRRGEPCSQGHDRRVEQRTIAFRAPLALERTLSCTQFSTPRRVCIIITSLRTRSISCSRFNFSFEMDLHANFCPVALSVASYTVPRYPRPSSRPKLK